MTTYTAYQLRERTTPLYYVTLVDAAGEPIPDLATLTLTWYDLPTGEIVNARDHQDALNANQVIFAAGVVNWQMTEEDTAMLDEGHEAETRIAMWEWTHGTDPVLKNRHLARFRIQGYTQAVAP